MFNNLSKLRDRIPGRALLLIIIGGLLGILFTAGSYVAVHASSTPDFCMSCHEMKVVGEQGWMHSPHYHNDKGVVAECADCHVPPEIGHMLWVKTRDGVTDVVMHVFGESDPRKMDWDHLAVIARGKISDSSCTRCHKNLTAKGLPVGALIAHREYALMKDRKKCVDCHRDEFHSRFREQLLTTGKVE